MVCAPICPAALAPVLLSLGVGASFALKPFSYGDFMHPRRFYLVAGIFFLVVGILNIGAVVLVRRLARADTAAR